MSFRHRLPSIAVMVALAFAGVASADEFTYWAHWGPADVDGPLNNVIVPQFKEETGLDVVVVRKHDYLEDLTLAEAAGTPPDLAIIKNDGLPQLVEAGLLEPIDGLLAGSNVIRPQDYAPATWSMGEWQGKMYAVPAIEVGPVGALAFRRDLFADAGLPNRVPLSVDEMRSFHQKLTKTNADHTLRQLGFHPWIAFGRSLYAWASLYGIEWYDSQTDKISLYNDSMIDMTRDMFWYFDNVGGYEAAQAFAGQIGNWAGAFASGKLGMMMTGYYNVGGITAQFGMDPATFGHSWFPNPLGDHWIMVRGGMAVIPKGAKHPQAAMRMIELLAQGAGPKAIFDNAGFLNGNVRAIQQLGIAPNSDLQFFSTAAFRADRVGTMPKFTHFGEVNSAWTDAVTEVAQGKQNLVEALQNVERSFNNA